MRSWAWVILGISGACAGWAVFWLLLEQFTNGWDDYSWDYLSIYALPPLLIAAFGASFLYIRRKSDRKSDEQFWVALALYAAFGAYLLLFLYVAVLGFGTS